MIKKKSEERSRKKVTAREIAKKAGVSVATVSYVLNDSGSVSERVKRKVRRIANEMGYRPNRSAQAVRTGKTRTIGLVLPDLTNPFFPQLAQAIENKAREKSYSVFLVDSINSLDAEDEGIEQLIRQGVEGIIWCPVGTRDVFREKSWETAVVVIDRPISDYDSVCSDYLSGGALLANYIATQNHSKIGIIHGPKDLQSAYLRNRGFKESLEAGREIVWEVENEFSLHLNPNVERRIREGDVSVIVAGNDMIAIGALLSLRRRNIEVPKQVSVAGFDDIPWSAIVTPALTTVRQPFVELGDECFNLLMRRIEEPNASPRHIQLGVSLVARESVASYH